MNYLIDTCVISELIKPNPSSKGVKWMREHDEGSFYLSVLTIGEIYKGIEKLKSEKKKNRLRLWVENDLKERFRNRILEIDVHVAETWGTIQGKCENDGNPMPSIDGLIAATALANHMAVVTRNVTDMEASGAVLINPWKE